MSEVSPVTRNEKKEEDPSGATGDYIERRYQEAIQYYWKASRTNKAWYKITRSLTVIFGALVTLIASLSSSSIFADSDFLKTSFLLATPIAAALLTIIVGFSQSFQWGSAWQNMVLTAQKLQKEYDTYLITPHSERDYSAEVSKLNSYVISETESFFERMLGGGRPSKTTARDKFPSTG